MAYEGLAVITLSGRAAFNGRIRLLHERLDQPLRWRKPRRVFVNSMSDLFHEDVPDDFSRRVWWHMAESYRQGRGHVFQVLTKRPERMERWADENVYGPAEFGDWTLSDIGGGLLPNVWLGTSVEDQDAADERIPHLLRTPAAVRFLSCEPLLGPIDLADAAGVTWWDDPVAGIHWVIVGGESGLGVPERHTLEELLSKYHAGRQKKWEGSSNKRHQQAMREFWLDRLGKATDVRQLAGMAGEIERVASAEADARAWSPRTEGKYLKYLVTAVNYGRAS